MRYENCGTIEYGMVNSVIKEHFSEPSHAVRLTNIRWKLVFDTKKKTIKGKIRFAEIKRVNEFVEHLAEDEFDYVIIIDQNIWDAISDSDRIRIIRHELRHCFIDPESANPFKIVPHDYEDFKEEVILNADDPNWTTRVALIAESIYAKDE